jgi:DNA-directed RNA polymerase specialized sigma24 family protein
MVTTMDIKDALTLNPMPETVQDALRRMRIRHSTNTAYIVFHRHYVDGEPYDKISAEIMYPVKTCWHYASKMMRELKKEMEAK